MQRIWAKQKKRYWSPIGKRDREHLGSAFGIVLEEEIVDYLIELQNEKLIHSFVRHDQWSPEDMEGRDFTVQKYKHGIVVQVSFGVTISGESYLKDRVRYRPVPQFWFPVGTAKRLIVDSILTLFKG